MDGLLHVRLEILHAEAQAVEAHASQPFEPPAVDGPWINLDGLLAFGAQRECVTEYRQQPLQALVVEEGRRPPAQMQLTDDRTATELRHLQGHLARQVVDISCRLLGPCDA